MKNPVVILTKNEGIIMEIVCLQTMFYMYIFSGDDFTSIFE